MSNVSTMPVLFLGPMELGVGLAIVVLLFGAKKIPKLARSSGEAIGEFKKGREEMEEEIKEMKSEETGTTNESNGVAGGDPRQTTNETEPVDK